MMRLRLLRPTPQAARSANRGWDTHAQLVATQNKRHARTRRPSRPSRTGWASSSLLMAGLGLFGQKCNRRNHAHLNRLQILY
jgi:hypothetical protein